MTKITMPIATTVEMTIAKITAVSIKPIITIFDSDRKSTAGCQKACQHSAILCQDSAKHCKPVVRIPQITKKSPMKSEISA
jgi:hypothetical protein